MNELEERVSRALRQGSEEAPSAAGLVGAARGRARKRRQTRLVLGSAGAVAALIGGLAITTPLLGSEGSPDAPAASATEADQSVVWSTRTIEGVSFEVPTDWVKRTDCPYRGMDFAPIGGSCAESVGVLSEALFDVSGYPGRLSRAEGAWGGFVYASSQVVIARAADHDTARRILASARPADVPAVDVSEWERVELPSGVSATVPTSGDASVGGVVSLNERGEGFDCEPRQVAVVERQGDDWVAVRCDYRMVDVSAPTQALTDVVAATLTGLDE